MLNFLKKSLSYIVTGSCSIVFAACYGPPVRLENPKLINVKSEDNEAIQGLKVTLVENNKAIDQQFTNEKGTVEFSFAQKDTYIYEAIIEDVDGTDNLGNFKSLTVDLTSESIKDVNLENME